MVEIKSKETHLERLIEIKRQRFNALLTTGVTWHHVDGPLEIQRPRLSRNDLQSCISSEPLIKD